MVRVAGAFVFAGFFVPALDSGFFAAPSLPRPATYATKKLLPLCRSFVEAAAIHVHFNASAAYWRLLTVRSGGRRDHAIPADRTNEEFAARCVLPPQIYAAGSAWGYTTRKHRGCR